MACPLEIGNRRELFVDETLLDASCGIALQLHAPERREIVLSFDDPAFSRSGFHNLFIDGRRIRLYYRGEVAPETAPAKGEAGAVPLVLGREQTAQTTTHYAESEDGIHFVIPELGLIEWRGSKRNNVILTGHEAQNFCVFRDDNPECLPDEKYKAVGGDIEPPTLSGPKQGLVPYVSPDGQCWKRKPGFLAVRGMFDSLNVPFWDKIHKCYRLFSRFTEFRYPSPGAQWPNYCRRDIQSCTSPDFIHWTEPLLHDYSPGDYDEQYYTNATHPCPGAEHILLSFPMRFVETRTKFNESPHPGISDIVFMSSRDGHRWRRYAEAYVRPDMDPRNWVSRALIMASGIIPTSAEEWSLYLGERYLSAANCLRRLAVRPWGFASLHAGSAAGEVVTKPLCFGAGTLRLNYATSAAGCVKVEILSADGKVLPGYSQDVMDELFGNELDGVVSWNRKSDLTELRQRPVRLRFVLKDADVFAFRISAD